MTRKLDRGAVWCIVANIVVAAVVGTYIGIASFGVKTEETWIHPSSPYDWSLENETIQLHGRLYSPPFFNVGSKYPAILFFHGVTRTLEDLDEPARRLAMKGCVCLSIDFHGHGDSEGAFPISNWARYNESFGDAAGAYRWLQAQPFVDPTRIGAVGQSMGGGAAIYLSLWNLTSAFVAWYPATTYKWINTPLYEYTSTWSSFKGFVIQGTNDIVCLPNYTRSFVDNNPSKVGLYWVEGGVHGATTVDWPLYVEKTSTWFADTWQLQDVLPFPPMWIYAVYIALSILALAGLIGVLVLTSRALKKKKIERSKQEPGASGEPVNV